MGTDWDLFRRAILAFLHGQNPYLVGTGFMRFYNPPWTLPLLAPFLLFGKYAILVLAIVSVASLVAVSVRLRLGALGALLVVTSAMHLQSVRAGNIEWLPWLGIFFPAPIAMLFYLIKPQVTIGVILLLLQDQWMRFGWRGIARTTAPAVVLLLLAILAWGVPSTPTASSWNLSLFPFSLLIGLPTLVIALRRRSFRLAAFAGPWLVPYQSYHGYLSILFAFSGVPMLAVWAISYVPLLFFGVT